MRICQRVNIITSKTNRFTNEGKTDSVKEIFPIFLMQHYCKIVTERSADKEINSYKVPRNISQSLMDKPWKENHSGQSILVFTIMITENRTTNNSLYTL